jgi:Amt family ammonium transporter
VAESCTLTAYMIYPTVLTGFIYPIVMNMSWDSAGPISAFNSGSPILGGVVDFAGSGVVHMTGGVAAFAGAFFLGPRIGRFDSDGKPVPMPGHSLVLQALGVLSSGSTGTASTAAPPSPSSPRSTRVTSRACA